MGGKAGNQTKEYSPNQADLPFTKEQLNDATANALEQMSQYRSFLGQLSDQGALRNQREVFAQQQDLANQLMQQALGQGPNPVQQQYQKNLMNATQQAAGTIASQKGISPALMAELIARQQGNANQNMAIDNAMLQAQQQLNAQQALAGQQNAMQNVAGNQVGLLADAQKADAQLLNERERYTHDLQNDTNKMNLDAYAKSREGYRTSTSPWGAVGSAAGAGLGLWASGGSPEGGMQGAKLGGAVGGMFAEGGSVEEPEVIPGTPKVPYNSYENDVVDVKASPGEVFLPLSVMNSKNPSKEAAKFVQAIIDDKKKSPKEQFKDALKEAIKSRGKK